MLSCREASHLLSDQMDRPLRPSERLTLRIHLAMCRSCSRAEEQLRFIRKAIVEFVERRDGGGSAPK
jgi:hypothetical protein